MFPDRAAETCCIRIVPSREYLLKELKKLKCGGGGGTRDLLRELLLPRREAVIKCVLRLHAPADPRSFK